MDNGSTDGSVELARGRFPGVKVIEVGRNVGFARANNIGVEASRSPYVATLNNDAVADPHWLAELVRVVETDPKVGMGASKMLFCHQPHIINSTGINLDLAGIAWDRRVGEPDDGEDHPVEVFGACAGAALYRRAMLEDVGLFDEDFFAYLEDVDLAWRGRLAGWKSLYVPTARVRHIHSGTGVEGSAFKNYLLGRNKVFTIIKNYPMPELLLFLPLILFYDLASLPYTMVIKGDLSPLKGRLAGLLRLPHLLAKRKEIQRKRRRSSPSMAMVSPLESPFRIMYRMKRLRALTSTEVVGGLA